MMALLPMLESESSSSSEKLPSPTDSGWHSVMIEERLTLRLRPSAQDMEARRSMLEVLWERECSLLSSVAEHDGRE